MTSSVAFILVIMDWIYVFDMKLLREDNVCGSV